VGLKRGKYAYIKISKDTYVKVRVLKGKADNVPEKYIVVGPLVKKPPVTARVIDILELPKEVADRVISQLYGA